MGDTHALPFKRLSDFDKNNSIFNSVAIFPFVVNFVVVVVIVYLYREFIFHITHFDRYQDIYCCSVCRRRRIRMRKRCK